MHTAARSAVACAATMLVLAAAAIHTRAARSCSTCARPVHSWDTLPVFFHGSVQTTVAGTRGGFSSSAIKFLTQFASVTIEKWQGDQAPEGFIWEEDAMLEAARQLKSARPDLAVFVWFDSVRIYTANKTLDPGAKGACGTGHFRPAEFLDSHPHPYLLFNSSGQPALEPWSGCTIYNHADPTVRLFWQDMCLNMTVSGFVDGCGADASWQTDPAGSSLTNATAAAWDIGHRQMMSATTAALQNGVLLGKMPDELGVHVNGVLHEGCVANNQTILTLQQLSERATTQGRHLVYQCHATCNAARGGCADSVAAFLVGAGDDHYWGFGGWNEPTEAGLDGHWITDLFDKPLGAPQGPGQYDGSTHTWTRKFASGTEVTFNAATKRGSITWAS